MALRCFIALARPALLLSAAFWGAAGADELPGHAHEPLPVDTAMSLVETIDGALAAYPDIRILAAREAQASAWSNRGNSWLRQPPALVMRYQSDRLGSDVGLEEYEAGVDLPLWRWGGRAAVRSLGDALSLESEAAARELRWRVAGLVRLLLWEVALAENDHELSELALETADRLASVVQRRYELGDVSLSDVLLARSSLLEFRTAVIEADAMLLDAERAYRSITGLDRRPEFVLEPLSQLHEVAIEHPALALANAAVARADANVEVARKTTTNGANVMVGTRRERSALEPLLDDSIGIVVNVPFGGASHRDARAGDALRVASGARAARDQELRALDLALHEAAHSLSVVRQSLETASERLEIAERQQTMGESAYEKGELDLMDLLKLQATTIAARQQLTRLTIDEKRQTAMYNQAVGEVP